MYSNFLPLQETVRMGERREDNKKKRKERKEEKWIEEKRRNRKEWKRIPSIDPSRAKSKKWDALSASHQNRVYAEERGLSFCGNGDRCVRLRERGKLNWVVLERKRRRKKETLDRWGLWEKKYCSNMNIFEWKRGKGEERGTYRKAWSVEGRSRSRGENRGLPDGDELVVVVRVPRGPLHILCLHISCNSNNNIRHKMKWNK